MNNGERRRLENLCAVFNIPVSATDPDPDLALSVLIHIYAAPLIEDNEERREYLNQVRGNLAGHFDTYSVFVGKTAELAALMYVLPHWYADLNRSTEELVEMYKDIERAVYWLNKAGWGAGGGAAIAGLAETIKKGSVKDGIVKAGRGIAGQGQLLEAVVEWVGRRAPKVAKGAGIVGGVVVVGGSIAYYSGLQRMEDIKEILTDRFHSGQMTDEQYREVFGEDFRPEDVKMYWEM